MRFDFKKLNYLEFTEQCQIEVSDTCSFRIFYCQCEY